MESGSKKETGISDTTNRTPLYYKRETGISDITVRMRMNNRNI